MVKFKIKEYLRLLTPSIEGYGKKHFIVVVKEEF